MPVLSQFWESGPVDDTQRIWFTAEGNGRVLAGSSPLGVMLTQEQVVSLAAYLLRVGGAE